MIPFLFAGYLRQLGTWGEKIGRFGLLLAGGLPEGNG